MEQVSGTGQRHWGLVEQVSVTGQGHWGLVEQVIGTGQRHVAVSCMIAVAATACGVRTTPTNQPTFQPTPLLPAQVQPSTRATQMAWSLREMLGLKYTPACITVVNAEGAGRMLMQNSASMALYGERIEQVVVLDAVLPVTSHLAHPDHHLMFAGCHGLYNQLPSGCSHVASDGEGLPPAVSPSDPSAPLLHSSETKCFLEQLFGLAQVRTGYREFEDGYRGFEDAPVSTFKTEHWDGMYPPPPIKHCLPYVVDGNERGGLRRRHLPLAHRCYRSQATRLHGPQARAGRALRCPGTKRILHQGVRSLTGMLLPPLPPWLP